ncbi:hypothetical protein WH52_04785 [Tenacibaculum holothuriorum]|uniref:Nicotinic acid mononucleotide adenyltransferase n=1 Tax=Tenacibaculum holothuriorum TaxID=1635173 RepID=A0A1Y2PES4_9FLAO|nr:hypothetical protein [Tenacibaculum holothuriorum]OSY88982.1 hypothetical protein WH52_04785 [Tenacibaculum holothuriorum]
MKRIKLLFAILITSSIFTSCVVDNGPIDDSIPLNEFISSYDLWYVDIHRTTGNGEIPFLQKAFTISFLNGTMYANNNIVDIGKTGNGLGIVTGNYNGIRDVLEINHRLDGAYDFRVVQLSRDEIRLDDLNSNLSYYLIGYQRNNFDYDKLFYDNIEFFLQEFLAWERTHAEGGTPNPFDDENFLQFTPENNTTFSSSHDPFGTNIDYIKWDFIGSYIVRNVQGVDDLKYLTLNYDNGDTEEFDLTVINDETIRLYHVNSKTTYEYSGRGFIQYLKGDKKSTKPATRNSNRKRTKITRETVHKRN